MRLIKPGDKQRCKKIVVFHCPDCSAIFSTGPHERYVQEDREWARCPECNTETSDRGVPVEVRWPGDD